MPTHRHAMTVAAALLLASAAHASPPVPTNVTATAAADGGVTLTWQVSAETMTSRVYSAAGVELAEVMGTSYTAEPGFRGFAVSACDAFGACSRLSSPIARVPTDRTPTTPTDCPVFVAPADEVPGNVTVEFSASGGGVVEFDAVEGADTYLLHVDGEYATFIEAGGPLRFELPVGSAMDARYQVSAEIGDVYFPKSAPAVSPEVMAQAPDPTPDETPDEPDTPATPPTPTTPTLCETEQAALTAELDAARARIAALEADDGADVTALRAELASAEEDLAAALDLLDDAEALLAADAETIAALEREKADLTATIAARDARIAELEAELAAGGETTTPPAAPAAPATGALLPPPPPSAPEG